jgi:EmrB/QacA subfamily drug resistance transporter
LYGHSHDGIAERRAGVCLAGFILVGAALGDRFGRRRMMLIGLAAFTAGSATCALAPSAGVLIAGRTVQGVGAALLAPLAVPLISAAYPPERRGRALGIAAGVTGLATFAGPVVGGAVTQALGWQGIFWLNVPVGLVLLLLVRGRVPESRGPRRCLDVRGTVLATGALVAASWGLVRAADAGWTAPDVAAGLAVGVALTAAFLVAERTAAEPLVDVAFLRSRPFGAVSVATLCHSAVVLGAVFLMAQFLEAELGVGSFGAGVRLLPLTGSMMLVAPVAGRLADRIGPRPVIAGGLLLAGAGYAWLAALSRPPVSCGSLVAPLVILGIGNSAVFPAVSAAVSTSVGADRMGPAAGLNNAVRQIGGVLGIATAALVFTGTGSFATANHRRQRIPRRRGAVRRARRRRSGRRHPRHAATVPPAPAPTLADGGGYRSCGRGCVMSGRATLSPARAATLPRRGQPSRHTEKGKQI